MPCAMAARHCAGAVWQSDDALMWRSSAAAWRGSRRAGAWRGPACRTSRSWSLRTKSEAPHARAAIASATIPGARTTCRCRRATWTRCASSYVSSTFCVASTRRAGDLSRRDAVSKSTGARVLQRPLVRGPVSASGGLGGRSAPVRALSRRGQPLGDDAIERGGVAPLRCRAASARGLRQSWIS